MLLDGLQADEVGGGVDPEQAVDGAVGIESAVDDGIEGLSLLVTLGKESVSGQLEADEDGVACGEAFT